MNIPYPQKKRTNTHKIQTCTATEKKQMPEFRPSDVLCNISDDPFDFHTAFNCPIWVES